MTEQQDVRLRTKNVNRLIFLYLHSFGLLIVAFITVFAYLYMQLIEKRFKVTRIV